MEIKPEQKLFFLMSVLWLGVFLDGAYALDMTIVGFFGSTTFLSQLFSTTLIVSLEGQYALILAAATMWGWTVLLAWAALDPLERKSIALITAFPVVIILMSANILAVINGLVIAQEMILTLAFQSMLIVLFVLAFLMNREHV